MCCVCTCVCLHVCVCLCLCLCVCVCVCVILNQSTSKNPHYMSDLSKLDALLHTTYINTIPPLLLFLLQISPPPPPPLFKALSKHFCWPQFVMKDWVFMKDVCVRMLALHMVCCKPTFGPGAVPLEDLAISPIPGFQIALPCIIWWPNLFIF